LHDLAVQQHLRAVYKALKGEYERLVETLEGTSWRLKRIAQMQASTSFALGPPSDANSLAGFTASRSRTSRVELQLPESTKVNPLRRWL
jgi:hypothetical protein